MNWIGMAYSFWVMDLILSALIQAVCFDKNPIHICTFFHPYMSNPNGSLVLIWNLRLIAQSDILLWYLPNPNLINADPSSPHELRKARVNKVGLQSAILNRS
jgi:hypothetical protein